MIQIFNYVINLFITRFIITRATITRAITKVTTRDVTGGEGFELDFSFTFSSFSMIHAWELAYTDEHRGEEDSSFGLH